MSFVSGVGKEDVRASQRAVALALLQREAPYCSTCRSMCIAEARSVDEAVYSCRKCGTTFDKTVSLPREEPVMIHRGQSDEEQVLENMRIGVNRSIGPEEQAILDLMRNGDLAEDDLKLTEEIDQEVAAVSDDDEVENWRTGMCRKCGAKAKSKTGAICTKCEIKADAVLKPCNDCGIPTPEKVRKRRIGKCQECYKAYLQKRKAATMTYCGCGFPSNHRGRCRDGQSKHNRRDVAVQVGTNNGTNSTTQKPEPITTESVNADISEDKIGVAKELDIIPELSGQATQTVTRQTEIHGSLVLREEVQLKVEEIAQWPAERIAEFFDAISKVVSIPKRTFPTTIKRAWPKDFEDDSEEGVPALTMMYLVSMLHDGMEEHEKQAVFTLILYLKRVEAAREAEKEMSKNGGS